MIDRGAELIVLFGNELPEVPAAHAGPRVGEVKVHGQRLAAALVAVAVVDLVRRGVGTLDVESRHGLQLRGRLFVVATGDAPGFTGLVARSAPRQEVRQVALHLFGKPTREPASRLLSLARQPFLDEGVLVKHEPNGMKRLIAGPTWEVDEGRRAALRPAWNELLAAWEGWKIAQPHLVGPLMDEAQKALLVAAPADNNTIS